MFHQRTQFGASTVVGQHWLTGGGPDIVTGLVSRWMFTEGSGTTVADNAPTPKSNITIVPGGSSAWGSGFYHFEGAPGDGYAVANDHAAYNFGSALTVFGWVFTAVYGGSGPFCFGQYDFGTTPGQRSWGIQIVNQQQNVLLVDSSSQSLRKNYVGTTVVFDSNWHSIGFVWNGSILKLYADGLLDTVATINQDDAVTSLCNSTAQLSFAGALNNGVISSQMTVSLQRIYLFNVVKTAADMAALHALGHA